MYVCICNEVTDKAIIQAANNGAESLKDLQEILSVATDCGRCAGCAKHLLATAGLSDSDLCLQSA